VDHVGALGSINVDSVSSSTPWTESTVTGLTGVAPQTPIATGIPIKPANVYLSMDATSAVQGWITSPSSNNGFYLAANSGNFQSGSKENSSTSGLSLSNR
jgi:hypothetical protein